MATVQNREQSLKPEGTFHVWAPHVAGWANEWSGGEPAFYQFAQKMVPYFEDFLQSIYQSGVTRGTFRKYCDDANLLGYLIFKDFMMAGEVIDPSLAPLTKLTDVIRNHECSLPWRGSSPTIAECASYERMYSKFAKFLEGKA